MSWCTESFGCVQTIAKGARRQKSPFAGKLDLFFEAEISIVRSRKSDLHTLTEVVLKNPFAGIRSNYLRTQSAAYFVELIEICTERDHREPELLGLLRRAFGYLNANDPTARAVAHFETELARIAGVHDQSRLKADPAFALGNLFEETEGDFIFSFNPGFGFGGIIIFEPTIRVGDLLTVIIIHLVGLMCLRIDDRALAGKQRR